MSSLAIKIEDMNEYHISMQLNQLLKETMLDLEEECLFLPDYQDFKNESR